MIHIQKFVGCISVGISAESHRDQHFYQGRIVVGVLVIIDLPVIAVEFLVSAATNAAHGDSCHTIRVRAFKVLWTTASGAGGIVDQLILEHGSFVAIGELVLEPFIIKL